MFKGLHVVFAGGDARMLEVVRRLADAGATVSLLGFDQASQLPNQAKHAHTAAECFGTADAVILPMSGVDDQGRVDTRFSTRTLFLHDRDFARLRPGTFVFTGIARPSLEACCQHLDLRLVKLMDLDEVAILNSIPTAEGAIAMAMEMMDITIHGSNAIVIGFGRCGVTLCRDLHALGARVRVVARRPSDIARIREMGLQPVVYSDIKEALSTADLVVNTVPQSVLTADRLDELPASAVVVDIASKPGGTDFDHAAQIGLKAKLAPSLPGLVAPKTAGGILADTILRLLRDDMPNRPVA